MLDINHYSFFYVFLHLLRVYIKGGSRGGMKTKKMRMRKKFFSDPLTAGEKLIKLKVSIQDFLLLGPVRLLPLGDRAFSFRSCFIPSRNIPLFLPLSFSVRCRLIFRSRAIKCIAGKNKC